MSHPGKSLHEMGLDSLPDRFQDSFGLDHNKPDFKELDLGSPISPLITRADSDGGGGATTTANTSSSSSSFTSVSNHTPRVQRSIRNPTNHSGELETSRSVATTRNSKPGHRRSNSTGPPLIYSGSGSLYNNNNSSSSGSSTTNSGGSCGGGSAGSVSSPNTTIYPIGNICPSGKILKSNMASRSSNRAETLSSGTGHYGIGSIVRGGGKVEANVSGNTAFAGESAMVKRAMSSSDPEEVKKAGNELYRSGHIVEALSLYNRAIAISPDNAAYRSNRAAALTMLGRLGEAVRECEEAVRLDPGYVRSHQRLASLYIRLGQVENARHHLCFHGQQPDTTELQKLHSLEKHLNRCSDARKIGDWKSALKECDAAIVAGAESSPQIIAGKAEAFLKLQQLEDADSSMSNIPKLDPYPPSCSQTKFFGMHSEAFVLYVRAQVDMAFGRFENAVAAAEKAGLIDYSNIEVAMLLNNVKSVTRARARGKDLFDSGRFAEACTAYGEGLKYNLSNSVLYCNRGVCWSKLGLWEHSVEDCNQALKIQPNYTKALLRRAASNAKLERWVEAVRDYEALRRYLPGDNEVAESLHHAQVALKKFRGAEVHSMKFGSAMVEVTGLDQFKAAISSPGVSLVHFMMASNQQCEQISPFVDLLCARYPSVNFLKVNVEQSAAIAKAESVSLVPTFNIYKNGDKVKEIISPRHQDLESLLRQQSL
ncbi:inactive TPR repeat-containing thioredoxin TTL3 [Cornus florida]|uniref:inactive TPR repeat-containing thioredoxin TTL3 n=1 Tax=Cornus florida TaxID=4283 RepID=UPI002899852D|nr:inactive TPR repeat-containing thioredoxin TTL3 [Cornus florida]